LVNLEGALSSEVLASEFNETFFKKYKLAAIEVNEGNQSYHFENHLVAAGDYFRVEKSVPFRDRSGVETSVDLKLFFPAIKEQIIKQRKNVLVLMAIGVMLFGVLIERIITLFLHHPISSLVRATNRVSEGNMNFRLETDRTDEFGELSRFFNQMLDQILEDQTFVKNTLAYITAIIDHMADALIVMDINGIITHANPSFYKMFGKKRNEIIGSNIENIHYLLNIKDMKKISGDSPGEIFEGEVQLKDNRIGKSIATTVVDSINYQDAEGTAPGMIIIIRDVTNEKEADKMKTDFLSIVSHELRTPLTSVVGFSKVIKRKLNREIFPFMENINEETKKSMRQVKTDVDIIVSEGNRLTSLINDVLDIAKMEAGKTEWKMKAMDISEAMLRAKTVTLPLIENKNIEILCEFENDLPLVMGDHDKIVQVLINLLSNAIKFTDSGKITCKIFKRDDQKMQVSVKDEGIGIAPSDQPLIFEKFKQSGYILTDRPRGTGLGLPICKHIIQQHAGEIWVESVPAEGSVFSFTIPFLQEEERNIEFKNFDIFMERMELLFPFSGKTGKKDILIIDDQHTMRTNLKNEFEKYGCLVRYAGTVFEAINDLQKGKPDLILIFIKMPLINAIEASVLLEENKESENIPFAILTAREDHHETLLGLNRYFSRSFSKEFLESELIGFSDSFRNKNAMILEENGFPEENLEEMLQNAGFSEVILCRSDEIIKKACSRKPDIIFSSKKSINQNHIFDILRYDPSIGDSIFLIMDR
ncbi:MAG: ATP-binding protein, partial [Spirochaetia bacterium]|nr:ATP-binding protein [Spirochaetia bacterium]